jgi:hypothetical protein
MAAEWASLVGRKVLRSQHLNLVPGMSSNGLKMRYHCWTSREVNQNCGRTMIDKESWFYGIYGPKID